MGRHTTYTVELAIKICDVIASENESLNKLHQKYSWFPHRDTIVEWRKAYAGFSDIYMIAKKKQALLTDDSLKEKAEEMLSFAYKDEKGNLKIDAGIVAAYNAIFKNIRWGGERLARGTYGDIRSETDQVEQHKLVIELKHD